MTEHHRFVMMHFNKKCEEKGGTRSMAKRLSDEIRLAEEEASLLVKQASDEAAAIRAAGVAAAEQELTECQRRADIFRREAKEAREKEAADRLAEAEKAAQKEADALKKQAEEKLSPAVSMILEKAGALWR